MARDTVFQSPLSDLVDKVLAEIHHILKTVKHRDIQKLATEILQANKIVLTGAGRVGLATRGFGMRLGHLGLNAHTLGDSTVPGISDGDLFLVSSGSGETQTIYDLCVIAKKNGARLALITSNPKSRMGILADSIVRLRAPSKTKPIRGFKSIQPMTTLNEQCLTILFDAIVLLLMERMGETHDTMWARHSSLE